MLFGVKNGPPTYQRIITKAFREYLDNFMKIFMMNLQCTMTWTVICRNSKLCFQKCKEYGISLNQNKCAFVVFSKMILGFIVFKERKLPYPKKIQVIINMPPLKIHYKYKYLMGWHNFTDVLSKTLLLLWHLSQN
jgi:hypothetical protein